MRWCGVEDPGRYEVVKGKGPWWFSSSAALSGETRSAIDCSCLVRCKDGCRPNEVISGWVGNRPSSLAVDRALSLLAQALFCLYCVSRHSQSLPRP
ncbi:unnamed protein product [Boreogadus saida]